MTAPKAAATVTRTVSRTTAEPQKEEQKAEATKPAANNKTPPVITSAILKKSSTSAEDNSKEIAAYKARAEETEKEVSDLRLELDDLTKERDFYFEKLREVEIALQEIVDDGRSNETTEALFKILYATAEGFEVQGGGLSEQQEESETA